MSTHLCTSDCWAYMVRYGAPDECNPIDAQDAADAENDEYIVTCDDCHGTGNIVIAGTRDLDACPTCHGNGWRAY